MSSFPLIRTFPLVCLCIIIAAPPNYNGVCLFSQGNSTQIVCKSPSKRVASSFSHSLANDLMVEVRDFIENMLDAAA